MFKIINIRRGPGFRRKYVYAQLVNEKGEVVINATLAYIAEIAPVRGLEIKNYKEAFEDLVHV